MIFILFTVYRKWVPYKNMNLFLRVSNNLELLAYGIFDSEGLRLCLPGFVEFWGPRGEPCLGKALRPCMATALKTQSGGLIWDSWATWKAKVRWSAVMKLQAHDSTLHLLSFPLYSSHCCNNQLQAGMICTSVVSLVRSHSFQGLSVNWWDCYRAQASYANIGGHGTSQPLEQLQSLSPCGDSGSAVQRGDQLGATPMHRLSCLPCFAALGPQLLFPGITSHIQLLSQAGIFQGNLGYGHSIPEVKLK